MPFNVTPTAMATAIQTLGTGPVVVTATGPDLTNGYVWDVTFYATDQNYDVPEMTYVLACLAPNPPPPPPLSVHLGL